MSKTTNIVLFKFKIKMHSQWPHLQHGSYSSSVARCFFSSSHDADHLLPCRLSHEPLINNPGHIVVAPAHPSQRSDPCGHALRLGLIDAGQDSQTSKGVFLGSLSRKGDSSLGAAAADVPEELLDQASVALSAGFRSTD